MTFFPFCEQCGKAVESAIHVVRDCDFVPINVKVVNTYDQLECWIKINVDGSVSVCNTKAAIGGAVRDSNGNWLTSFAMITRVSDVFQIETRSVVEGLKLAWSKGFIQCTKDWKVKFRYVLRKNNKVADCLAKAAIEKLNQLVLLTDPQQYITRLMLIIHCMRRPLSPYIPSF
ncbi:hypothetical protein Godav_009675 [Gossypium davidsonii]|uniref:RNase H type-1 domain-containing protein n=2 Tax=Gossypium TaxID=3633 RepID=A0A7J8SDZ2_GOSDV|nr:hypothetical protein [Gossypium davidsonii]MBA0659878.1 hypothetical protein [Gossypium klotzschianum]